mmetsp:Transcript_46717/g.69083  ORF Transcript_46717/g.69083 Transcript_46717/m.69083 type:complete len:534 (+) Transcript_46717:254-1855(+)|eukprot:CAMPEP_0195538886 /NCGR_PEP_ID=MMETSP0794_2-20130614/49768_1 /TAXON_ID=515487 /ORGANISM="Stephanopyxis turris, Strain CCMP 815" /LENGTH=533 /DNA_ID=CAMNT_0040672897 /DNA_START=254 /DNA_END=1855 /DNA_ORIENTATION=+
MPPNAKFPLDEDGDGGHDMLHNEIAEEVSNLGNFDGHGKSGELGNVTAHGVRIEIKEENRTPQNITSNGFHTTEIDSEYETRCARTYVKNLSQLVQDEEELTVDEKRLAKAVQYAGEYAFGIIGVEVWVLDEDSGMLVRPNGGWWVNSAMESEILHRLEDSSHPKYVPLDPIIPGEGLAGELWAESFSSVHPWSRTTGNRAHERGEDSSPSHPQNHHEHRRHWMPWMDFNRMVWRDLHSLQEDPDTAKGLRLALQEEAGFGLSAGIKFHTKFGYKGIVVYFSRSTVCKSKLSSTENDTYLQHAADLIGATFSLTESRRASVASKNRQFSGTCRKFRRNLIASMKDPLTEDPEDESMQSNYCSEKRYQAAGTCNKLSKKALKSIKRWGHKCLGGRLQPPPSMPLTQSLWTLAGCFFGLLVLSTMNECAKTFSDGDYFLLMGPFGALMTLQYGLTAAPASQPRNVVLGQAVAGAISLSFTYIPDSIIAPCEELLDQRLPSRPWSNLEFPTPQVRHTSINLLYLLFYQFFATIHLF